MRKIFLATVLFISLSSTPAFSFCNPPFGGEGDKCCKPGFPDLQCDGVTCECNSGFVCTPPQNNDPDPNWKCRISCGGLGQDCCVTNTPSNKCDPGLACHNQNGIRTCRDCGVLSGPCCVTGNQCGVDGGGDPLIPTGSGEACTCEEDNPPPIACGTDGYPCCLLNGGVVIGACDAGDIGTKTCTCSEGVCKSGAGAINPSYSTHCFIEEECGDSGQRCCEAPEPSCDSSQLLCVSNVCCVDSDGDGVCDSSNNQPKDMVYKGPIIDSLEKILGPVTKMLYYGGLFIGIAFIVFSGYKLMISQGNPRNTQEAQEQLTAAILGIIFILLSAAILRIILSGIFGGGSIDI